MYGTNQKTWTAELILLFAIATVSECDIGKACPGTRCSWSDLFETCTDGYCVCKEAGSLEYDEDTLKPDCGFTFSYLSKRCEDCPANSTCVKGSCQCDEGYLKINKRCREGKFQQVLQRCYIARNGDVHACDIREHSICKNRKCICFDNYFANKTSGKCEPHSSYMKLYGLTSYRVKPGVYCTDDSQCITGLRCSSNFECSCPSGCSYNAKDETCNCGKVEYATTWPIIVGIFLGILILAFWRWRIKKTIEGFKKKKSSEFLSVPEPSPSQNSYPLNPTNQASFSTQANVPADAHMIPPAAGFNIIDPCNPSFGTDLIPPKLDPVVNNAGTTPDPFMPPQPPPSHLENPENAPPPYSELPPPYVADPLNDNLAPTAPNLINSSGLPYPVSPAATAYPLNPVSSSYPSNPVATPQPSDLAPTPYSLNPAAPLSPSAPAARP